MSTGTQHHACLPDKPILDERSPPDTVAVGGPRLPRSSEALLEGDVVLRSIDLLRVAGDVHRDDVIPFAIDVQRSDVDVRYSNVNDPVGVHHLPVVMMHADRFGMCFQQGIDRPAIPAKLHVSIVGLFDEQVPCQLDVPVQFIDIRFPGKENAVAPSVAWIVGHAHDGDIIGVFDCTVQTDQMEIRFGEREPAVVIHARWWWGFGHVITIPSSMNGGRIVIMMHMDTDQSSIYEQLWDGLEQGSANRRHAFHTPVLATRSATGDPDLRTVVLRRVDRERRLVCCHTDSRSPKVREIQASGRVAWLFYDPASGVQIRAHGRCVVHTGADDVIACETWQRVHPDSRVCYAAPNAPSGAMDQWESNQSPDAREIALTKPTPADVPPHTFAVLATVLDSVEWLDLHHEGHQRVRFTLSDSDLPAAQWLAP